MLQVQSGESSVGNEVSLILGFPNYSALLRTQGQMGLLFRKEHPCACARVTQAHECAHALVLGQAGSGPPVWGLRGDVYVTLVTSQCESLQAPDGWHPGRHGPPSSALKAGVWGSPQSDFLPCVSPCAAWDMVTWHHLWFLSAGPSAGGSCLPSFFSALREQSPPCSRCL